MVFFVACIVLIVALLFVFLPKRDGSFPALGIWLWFGFFAILSQTGIFDIEKADLFVVLFVLLNVFIICLFVSFSNTNNGSAISSTYSDKKDFFHYFVLFFRILGSLLSVFLLFRLFRSVLNGSISFDALRIITYKFDESGSLYKNIYYSDSIYSIYSNFFRGFFVFDFGLMICKFFYKKGKPSLLSVFNVCSFSIIQLSRIELFRVVVIFILAMLCTGKISSQIKYLIGNKKMRFLLIFTVLVIVFVVVFRNYAKESYLGEAVKNLLGDATGPYVAFSTAVRDYNDGAVSISRGLIPYCESLLGGLSSFLIAIWNTLSKTNYVSGNTLVNNYTGAGILDIGIGYQFNAFYTMYCPPFLTGGLAGCILFSIFMGLLLWFSLKRKNDSAYAMWKFVYLIVIVIFGIFNYQWQSIASWVTLILTLLCGNHFFRSNTQIKREKTYERFIFH